MEVARTRQDAFHLFLDIFVHPSRKKIVAVAPHYGADWDPACAGIDREAIDLSFDGGRVRGRYIPHRLDSYEPCVLFDFEGAALEAALRERPEIVVTVTAGPHTKTFTLTTMPPPAYDVAMSLVVKDENRWIRTFLEYYLRCLEVEHVFVYDNGTADRETLLGILQPYRDAGAVTYVPWAYRWRNRVDPLHQMIGQPPQEAHTLNRFANTRWIGFFDTDELLRIPGQTLPELLADYERAQVDGLSFGFRWFRPLGPRTLAEVSDPALTFRHAQRDDYGRKAQKLIVSPRDVRFLRLHWLEEGKRELPIDDTDVFFHHYVLRPQRYRKVGSTVSVYDDHMLAFSERLRGLAPAECDAATNGKGRGRPEGAEAWIEHVLRAFEDAEAGRSGLTAEALAVQGQCGAANRHFLNRLCSFPGCRYLEIGSLHGASVCAAVSGNDVHAVCVDDWTQFGGAQATWEVNVRRVAKGSTVRLIEGDAFSVDVAGLGPFDVYLYDGDHGRRSHRVAIERFAAALADPAVVVVDDWNQPAVREGTRAALRGLTARGVIEVLFEREILLRDQDVEDMPRHRGRHSWWNGIGVFLLGQPTGARSGSV